MIQVESLCWSMFHQDLDVIKVVFFLDDVIHTLIIEIMKCGRVVLSVCVCHH